MVGRRVSSRPFGSRGRSRPLLGTPPPLLFISESDTLADMKNNASQAQVSQEEARAALEQIDGIEHNTQHKHIPPWAYAILGTSFGITIAGTIIGWKYWWVLFLLTMVACIALAIWDSNRNVRPSMKQPLQEDPKTNWAAALVPMLVFPLTWLVPEGSVVGGIIAGVITAVIFTAVLIYGEKNR